jgi:MFS family permease
MMVGTVVTATLGGFLITKFPYRNIIIPTFAILVAGLVLVSTLTQDSTKFIVTVYMVLIGLGIGASFSVLSNTAIHGLSARQRGSASATLNFIRSLGMTIGITVFGIIQSNLFLNKLKNAFGAGGDQNQMPEGLDLKDPHALLNPVTRAKISHDLLDKITEMLSSSIVSTFALAIIPAVLALLTAFFMGRQKLDSSAEVEEYAPSK